MQDSPEDDARRFRRDKFLPLLLATATLFSGMVVVLRALGDQLVIGAELRAEETGEIALSSLSRGSFSVPASGRRMARLLDDDRVLRMCVDPRGTRVSNNMISESGVSEDASNVRY